MSTMYDLPDLRPFRTIQHRMRLAGGAVVTENGRLESEDFLTGVSGWCIFGDGSVEFNDGTFRGDVEATNLILDGLTLLQTSAGFEVDTESWANVSNTSVARVSTSPHDGSWCLEVNCTTAAGTPQAQSGVIDISDVPVGRGLWVSMWINNIDGSMYQLRQSFYTDAGGTVLSKTAAIAAPPLAAGWVQLFCRVGRIDPGEVSLRFSISQRGTLAVNDTVRVDTWELYQESVMSGAKFSTLGDDVTVDGIEHVDIAGETIALYPNLQHAAATLELPAFALATNILSTPGGEVRPILYLSSPHYVGEDPALIFLVGADDTGTEPGTKVLLAGDEITVNDDDLVGPFISYSPTNTNITLGDGTLTAHYHRIGKWCAFNWYLLMGSTTSFGGGSISMGLPFNAKRAGALSGWARDAGTRGAAIGGHTTAGSKSVALQHDGAGNTGLIDSTNPFTVGTGDSYSMAGVYEIE